MRRTPVLILGGGPAGTAAAIALAAGGPAPLLLERTRDTGDALCGGFLSWRSLDTLAALGIAADALNRQAIRRTRLFAGAASMEAPLPRPALAVSRHRLDTLLLARATTVAGVERGVAVRSVAGQSGAGGEVRLADGAVLRPDTLFLATGKHDLRGLARPDDARGRDPTLGLRVRLSPHPTLDRLVGDAVELHLFPHGYAGVARQEDGSVNLCMAVGRSRLTAAGTPAALLDRLGRDHPALGDRLAFMAGDAAIDAVANIPYGWRARAGTPGLFRLGDQAGVIPSLAGEGMGIALASGRSAAAAHLGGMTGPAWQPRFARALARPLGIAGLARRLAEGPVAPWLVRHAPPALIQIIAHVTRIDHDVA